MGQLRQRVAFVVEGMAPVHRWGRCIGA
jgi:hypothetical protein